MQLNALFTSFSFDQHSAAAVLNNSLWERERKKVSEESRDFTRGQKIEENIFIYIWGNSSSSSSCYTWKPPRLFHFTTYLCGFLPRFKSGIDFFWQIQEVAIREAKLAGKSVFRQASSPFNEQKVPPSETNGVVIFRLHKEWQKWGT